jgi:methionine synthase II (cobalamin-independent)
MDYLKLNCARFIIDSYWISSSSSGNIIYSTKKGSQDMPVEEFNCLPTMIGSVPYAGAEQACEKVFRYLKDIPAWPQLTRRSFLENMYVQYSQGFPGAVVQGDKIFVDRTTDLNAPLEKLYSAYLKNDIYKFPITRDYAAGLHRFLAYQGVIVRAVKGQVTGPVSWGMTVADNDGRAIAYDDTLADAAAKLLRLKTAWMETELKKISRNTLIFVDEPYLHSIGSAFFSLSNEKVVSLINEVLGGINGIKGVHCCGKSDWSIILQTDLDVLSFDAYNYAESLALYPAQVKGLIDKGGVVAWGIVPNEEAALKKESAASLEDRLGEAIAPFTRQGVDIPFRQMITQSLLTPSCSLASLSSEGSDSALELLATLSERITKRYA